VLGSPQLLGFEGIRSMNMHYWYDDMVYVLEGFVGVMSNDPTTIRFCCKLALVVTVGGDRYWSRSMVIVGGDAL